MIRLNSVDFLVLFGLMIFKVCFCGILKFVLFVIFSVLKFLDMFLSVKIDIGIFREERIVMCIICVL